MIPAGLGLNTETGEISGKPSVAGPTDFEVEVTSAGRTATKELAITVDATPVLQPSELCSDNPVWAIAAFEDASLEAVIRAALSIGAQDALTCELISGLAKLEASSYAIGSLVGIQNLTSLTQLSLYDNSITDISALSGLTSLTELHLDDNSITDVSALSGLTSLTILYLHDNSIVDISALSGLTSLRVLNLRDNSITDISALSGLTSLTDLRLDNNPITDIQPLLDNTGLGPGDTVSLRDTSPRCADVAALEARGVDVDYNFCVFPPTVDLTVRLDLANTLPGDSLEIAEGVAGCAQRP